MSPSTEDAEEETTACFWRGAGFLKLFLTTATSFNLKELDSLDGAIPCASPETTMSSRLSESGISIARRSDARVARGLLILRSETTMGEEERNEGWDAAIIERLVTMFTNVVTPGHSLTSLPPFRGGCSLAA